MDRPRGISSACEHVYNMRVQVFAVPNHRIIVTIGSTLFHTASFALAETYFMIAGASS